MRVRWNVGYEQGSLSRDMLSIRVGVAVIRPGSISSFDSTEDGHSKKEGKTFDFFFGHPFSVYSYVCHSSRIFSAGEEKGDHTFAKFRVGVLIASDSY